MYITIDRHTTASDILEDFGTADHLMPAYSPWRRSSSRKAEARYYKTCPNPLKYNPTKLSTPLEVIHD